VPLRLVKGLALLSTGLLSGTFVYGAVNVAQTFKAVPLDVRLTFHSALMRMNGSVVQTMMALAILSSLLLVAGSAAAARGSTGTATGTHPPAHPGRREMRA